MKNIITDLKSSRRSQGRVHVHIDHRYAFTVNVFDTAALAVGQCLDPGVIARMKKKHAEHTAYVCAIRYLSYRQRSRKEVDRYLTVRKGLARETVTATIARLSEDGYLDDEEFARLFVESRMRTRPRSCAFMRYELSQKGIDDDVADAVLKGVNDEHLAWYAIESKLTQWSSLDPMVVKKRLIGFLQRRGFSLGVAMTVYRGARSQGNESTGSREIDYSRTIDSAD